MKAVLVTVIIFLVALFGIGAYLLGVNSKSLSLFPANTPTPTTPFVGNDRDEHGCIGSAGYTWCGQKQKCLRVWEEPCEEKLVALDTPAVIATIDETQIIKTSIKNALVSKHGDTANELTISVSKIQGNYAQGGASASGGGGMWFSAKVNGVWKLVWDGNGTISCADVNAYPDFPKDMISECYDETTQKMVTR